jgi:SAM-dependent methyltransferase
VPFFQALKVMDSQGKVFPTKYNKFRQINRYLEFIRDLLDVFPIDKPLKVVDFGCGKSYLTFAAYHYLHDMLGYQVTMVGLDLKKDVIDFCNQVAKTCYMDDLSFEVGDIGSYQQLSNVDLVFSLHACDTATDLAIAKAVESEAKVILAVPCCQHELFNQIKNQSNPFLLEQGIVKERIAALLTDVARHELLGAVGYKSQIIEFIETEHTPKNLLIRAIKGEVDRQTHHSNFLALKQEYGFEHTLETLLKFYL